MGRVGSSLIIGGLLVVLLIVALSSLAASTASLANASTSCTLGIALLLALLILPVALVLGASGGYLFGKHRGRAAAQRTSFHLGDVLARPAHLPDRTPDARQPRLAAPRYIMVQVPAERATPAELLGALGGIYALPPDSDADDGDGY